MTRRPAPTGEPAADGIRLDAVEFDGCWELLGLGDRPAALALPSPGRTHTERRAVLAAVLERLAGRGLADDRKRRPNGDIADLLGLLARPRHEIELYLGGGRTALAAIAGPRAVVVTRRGDEVHTLGVRAAEAVPRLVRLVGPMSPAAVRPVNIPAPALDQALEKAGDVWAVADELAARRVPRADASALARAFERVHELGQFSVAATVEGRRRPGPWAVGVHRADSGWVGSVRRGQTLSVFPVTADRLAARLGELVRHAG